MSAIPLTLRAPRRLSASRPLLVGGVAAAVLLALASLVEAWSTAQPGGWVPLAVALAAGLGACVLVALAFPITGLLLCQVVLLAPLLVIDDLGRGGTLLIGLLVLVAHAAYRRPWRPALAGYAISVLVPATALLLRGEGWWEFLFFGLILGAGLLVGVLLRREQTRSAELTRLASELRAERELRAQAAVVEERARISRELHDAVAHSVSVMTLQVGVVRRRLAGMGPDVDKERQALESAERLGRQSVDELRRVVGLIRDDDSGLAPRPGLARLEALVEHFAAAGLPVSLQIEEVELPPALDMSAYRVVQEALTNSLRHGGPGARATVTVRQSATDVVVEVVDDGLGADSPDASSVGGHGLLGMRERVGLFGGRLDAGPCPDGGYAVRAVLPVVAS